MICRRCFPRCKVLLTFGSRKMLKQDEVVEIMSLISRGTQSASLMLNNLLIWGKTQMVSDEVTLSRFKLNRIVYEKYGTVQASASSKKS